MIGRRKVDARSGHNEARFAPFETILSSFESSRRAPLHGTLQISKFQHLKAFQGLQKCFWQKTILDLGIRRFGGYHEAELVESFRMS